MKKLEDYPTPLTDALCSEPSIERRDVPARVWRNMADLERKLAAMTAERQADRVALENLHHEIGIDLPDEGMTMLQLVGNLLAASHEMDAAKIASLTAERDTANACLLQMQEAAKAITAERDEVKEVLAIQHRMLRDAEKARLEAQRKPAKSEEAR